VRVDVGSNDEPDNVEERHPGVLGEELLGKGQRDGRGDPADLHDGHETGPHGSADLVEGARARDNCHAAQVHGVLDGGDLRRVSIPGARQKGVSDRTYQQVAGEDLQDLGLDARPASEDPLQNSNEEVAQRGADEHSVEGHLGDAGAEVVTVLADIMGDPRGQDFLQTGQDTGGQHFSAQGVRLQLAKVEL